MNRLRPPYYDDWLSIGRQRRAAGASDEGARRGVLWRVAARLVAQPVETRGDRADLRLRGRPDERGNVDAADARVMARCEAWGERAARPGHRTFKPSNLQTFKPSNLQTFKPSN
ncbi:hypothetical protein, partial [Burkholderia thailandensis]|uniref:hypothetical protein n=1 Tax=Burkholderia thailandensis TaxID=57975 RepID=UPI001CA5425A